MFCKISISTSVLALALAPVFAQQEGSHSEGSATDDMQAMMAAYMKYAAPGEHHAKLSFMVGDWNVQGKFRMAPDAEWTEGPSEASFESVLDGRFLRQKVSSPPSAVMPFPFYGLGYLGYDNYKGQYVSIWMDSMMTMVLNGAGPGEEDQITLTGRYPDVVSGTEKTFKWVYGLSGKDEFTLTMYDQAADGSDFVNGVLVYKRK